MAKIRAYINDEDRSIIEQYSRMSHTSTSLILKKVNEKRAIKGLPLIKIKAIIEEIRRGGGKDGNGEGYNRHLAEKNYKFNSKKTIPMFDRRSQSILCYLILKAKLTDAVVLNIYKKLYKEKLVFSKIKGLKELGFLQHQGHLHHYDQTLWNRMLLASLDLKFRDSNIDMEDLRKNNPIYYAEEICRRFLKNEADYGKVILFGEKPEGYGETNEEAMIKEAEAKQVEIKQIEKVVTPPVTSEVSSDSVSDDVTTVVLPQGGKVKIMSTSSNVEYQLIRKGNDIVILL